MPIPAHEGGNQQDKGAFGLMEVRDHHVHQAELEARDDDDPGAHLQLVESVRLQIMDDGLKGFPGGIGVFPLLRGPLPDILRRAVLQAAHPHVIQGFQRPYRSCSNSD